MTYRERTIDRLTRSAINLQNQGRWDEADDRLNMAARFEALWAMLDKHGRGTWLR